MTHKVIEREGDLQPMLRPIGVKLKFCFPPTMVLSHRKAVGVV